MKVMLKNLEFFSYHGLYDFEKRDGGKFIVDVEIDEADKPEYLSIESVVNYETVFSIVNRRMNEPAHFIEEVARLILSDVRETFPGIASAKVVLKKCAPPIPGMRGEAVVECSF